MVLAAPRLEPAAAAVGAGVRDFPWRVAAVLTLHVPVPSLSSVITQTTLPPDLTVTVPVGVGRPCPRRAQPTGFGP